MNILLAFFISLSVSFPSYADGDVAKAPEEVIVREIHKNIKPLPECNDPKLIEKTKEYIHNYVADESAKSAISRRRGFFVKNKLAAFERKNIANYRTVETSPISDIIITLKMNKRILEENMRLCKNTSRYKEAGNIYILYHPVEKGIKVYVLNLKDRGTPIEDLSFVYE